jgi:ankyrin repeat protein
MTAPLDAAVSVIAELLERAIGRLCPAQAALSVRRSCPLRTPQRSSSCLVSNVACSLWHHCRRAGDTATWRTAATLAAALLAELVKSPELQRVVHTASAADDGRLLFLTAAAARGGALVCPLCSAGWPGKRALRNHLQSAHSCSQEDSISLVTAACASGGPRPPAAPRPLPPACTAARVGDCEALLRLADAGRLRERDAHGCCAAHWAAGGGHVASLQSILSCDRFAAGAECARGRTPLHWAARNGQLSVVQLLVCDHGADPGRGSLDGTTPLHLAAWQGHAEVLLWLAARGGLCAARRVNHFGCDAGHWAAMGGDAALPTLRALEALDGGWDWQAVNGAGHTPLHKAAARGAPAAAAWLCARPRPPHLEAVDAEGRSALQLAALWGCVDAVEELLAAGANACGAAGLAAAMGHAALAERLQLCDG